MSNFLLGISLTGDELTRVTELTSGDQCNALNAQIHRQNGICGNMTRNLQMGLKRFAERVKLWVLKAPRDK
jgi:hypothetical protein